MEFTEKDMKRIAISLIVLILGVLVFFVLKPVFLSVFAGLILAYAFFPVYKWTLSKVKSKNLASTLITTVLLLIILIPIWFVGPIAIRRFFSLFTKAYSFDYEALLYNFTPSLGSEAISNISSSLSSISTKFISGIVNSIADLFFNFANISLQIFIVGFVFFFALRDSDKLKNFMTGLSPLESKQEKLVISQFKNTTESIVYGQIIVGLVQGIISGIALLIFGVPNAFILTIIALLLSILPVIGPGLLYVPVSIYLALTDQTFIAIGYLAFNVLITSTIDNILRTHLVSRRTKMSQAIVLVGMMGGFLTFGVMGLLIGPLSLAYFITFLQAYKERTFSSAFEKSN